MVLLGPPEQLMAIPAKKFLHFAMLSASLGHAFT